MWRRKGHPPRLVVTDERPTAAWADPGAIPRPTDDPPRESPPVAVCLCRREDTRRVLHDRPGRSALTEPAGTARPRPTRPGSWPWSVGWTAGRPSPGSEQPDPQTRGATREGTTLDAAGVAKPGREGPVQGPARVPRVGRRSEQPVAAA